MQLVNFEGFEPGLVTTPLGLIVNSWVEEFLPSPWPVLVISSWAVMGLCQPTISRVVEYCSVPKIKFT